MSASLRIGRIFGIPIFIHITFLVILPLFVWVFSEGTGSMLGVTMGFGDLDVSPTVRYVFGATAATLFFATILTHELAHSYLAMKYGVRIRSITLMLFGGVASMEEMPKAPGQELKMAFAGPLSSLAIGAGSYAVMLVLDASGSATIVQGLAILFGLIALYNVLLAGFNLIPAFPMDGGRVLRSYLASRMSHLEATRKAAKVGRYMAIGMGFFGLIVLCNIWFILIAFFVYIGATEEEQATVISDSLEGLKVGQIMTGPVQVVHPEMSVHQLLDLMHSTRHMGFPVVMGGLVGIVTITDTRKVPRDRLYFAKVGDIMTKTGRDRLARYERHGRVQANEREEDRQVGRAPGRKTGGHPDHEGPDARGRPGRRSDEGAGADVLPAPAGPSATAA